MVTETVLQFIGLSKTFEATRALIDVDFDVKAGEVHGLVGRNGSGKSTLIKVLSGYHVPDPGSHLTLNGETVQLPLSGREAATRGLVFVHQDLGLIPDYSVLENIRLNSWESRGFQRINWKAERAQVEQELAQFGLDIAAETPVAALSQVDRAIVAIARAMHHLGRDGNGKVLVLDEPTAYLPTDSVERLAEAIRAAANTGVGIIFVSHRTDEVLALTDRITVLRDGRLVDTVHTKSTDEGALVSMILGQTLSSFYPDQIATKNGDRVLDVTGLTGDVIRDFSMRVDRGEIVGVTGLMGSGHDEIPYYLFGARDAHAGQITVNNQTLPTKKAKPTHAIKAGVALLPADRLNLSGSSAASIEDNVALPVFKRYFSRGRLQFAEVRARVSELLSAFDVRPALPHLDLSALSGGNQQKALLAKWLQMNPPLLLLHEPTQGVDVGSKTDIFARITAAAKNGTAVVIASAEHQDLANICTRVIVFDNGRVVGELAGAELTEENILDLCYRGARGRGTHGMVFQWRPYRIGFVPQGVEPEFVRLQNPPKTMQVFRWAPHRVGFIDVPVPQTPAVKTVRVFRWAPHRVGFIDIPVTTAKAPTPPAVQTVRVFRWAPHRVGFVDIPVTAVTAKTAPSTPAKASDTARVFRWAPHRVGFQDVSAPPPRQTPSDDMPVTIEKDFAKTGDLAAFLLEHIAAQDVIISEDGNGSVTIELRGTALKWSPETAANVIVARLRKFAVTAEFALTVRVTTEVEAANQEAADELAENWAENYRLHVTGPLNGTVQQYTVDAIKTVSADES